MKRPEHESCPHTQEIRLLLQRLDPHLAANPWTSSYDDGRTSPQDWEKAEYATVAAVDILPLSSSRDVALEVDPSAAALIAASPRLLRWALEEIERLRGTGNASSPRGRSDAA